MVERLLAKEKVAGSSPVSRSMTNASLAAHTKTAEAFPWGIGSIVMAVLDARVTGPGPMIIRFRGRENLQTKLGEEVQLSVREGIKVGDVVVVRRDEF